jgi:hypothetical protein
MLVPWPEQLKKYPVCRMPRRHPEVAKERRRDVARKLVKAVRSPENAEVLVVGKESKHGSAATVRDSMHCARAVRVQGAYDR